MPEHEKYRGKLAIPYLRKHPRHGWLCVGIRFRTLEDEKPKYLTVHGDRPRLYNTQALNAPGLTVGIAEGEIDAISATVAGMPTVGVPGATSWQDYWAELFRGYETVFVFADGDKAGDNLSRKLAKQLGNVKIIHCPEGEDVNSLFVSQGSESLQRMWS